MKIENALIHRILYYCDINNLSLNALANKCGITQSTLENIINGNSKNPKILTIVKICFGLNIKMKDFFDSKCFENFEFEDLI